MIFLSRKKWVVSDCNKDIAAFLAENCGVEPFAAFLMCSRGMTDEFEIESFLYDTDLLDPFTLPNMEEAVERISYAIENNEKITVFGDYDADGVTSTALLYLYLSSRGASVDYYIPDREGEGYGMNTDAIRTIKERGTKLIITVDNGISACEEIEYAKSLGMDVVVTDHHRVGEALPHATAVVDPHMESSLCDFSDWAGVGVAFKLICALDGSEGYELLEEYGDIVAVGTVADIVSLKGENRIIVRSGLAFMNAALNDGTLRVGLKALLEASGFQGKLDSSALAYRIAPRINAAGRMGSAERALKLLLSEDIAEARALAEEISAANAQRQATEAQISEAAVALIENHPEIKYKRVIVVDGENWHQGVIGIVASRLVEKYGKPCIVISKNGDTAKGSGRSIEGFSLYDALSYCSDILVQFGGHTLAAGMSVQRDNIDLFREKINEYADNIPQAVPVLNIDCKLNPKTLSFDVLDSMRILEPFGAENPEPLFGLYNMTITSVQPVSGGKHIRLCVSRKESSLAVMLFGVTPAQFPFRMGDTVDLAVKLSENEYHGKSQLSMQAKGVRFSGTNDDEVLRSIHIYEDFCAGKELSPEDKEMLGIDRAFCGKVYKYILVSGGWKFSTEVLCKRMGLTDCRVAACSIALDILSELGFVIKTDGSYEMCREDKKSAIENSSIFRRVTV